MNKLILLTASLIFLAGCGNNQLYEANNSVTSNAFLPPDTSNPKPTPCTTPKPPKPLVPCPSEKSSNIEAKALPCIAKN